MDRSQSVLIRNIVHSYLVRFSPDKARDLNLLFAASFARLGPELERETRAERPDWLAVWTRSHLKPTTVNLSTWATAVLVAIAHQNPAQSAYSRALEAFEEQCRLLPQSLLMEADSLIPELRKIIRKLGSAKAGTRANDLGTAEILLTRQTSDSVDLEIVVTTSQDGSTLDYRLHSPSGVLDLHKQNIQGKPLRRSLSSIRNYLTQRLEGFQLGIAGGADKVFLESELTNKLKALGQELYNDLFPEALRHLYRERIHNKATTIQITSEEPWIPWELVYPYDDSGSVIVNDGFLAERYELTRWFAGNSPPLSLGINTDETILFLSSGELKDDQEYDTLEGLSRELGVRFNCLRRPTPETLEEQLFSGGVRLIHFSVHGSFEPSHAQESILQLSEQTFLQPEDIFGERRTTLGADRPMVFLNSCQAAQMAWGMTRLDGWARTWVEDCRSSLFVGPMWSVKNSLAVQFAEIFYDHLAQGDAVGRAARMARAEVRRAQPGDPAWLAFHVYAHPNGKLR